MNEPAAAVERGLRAAALRGDAAAWRALYDGAFEAVARYARWRCGRADLAEDVVQEAWLTAARRLRTFDPDRARFAAWVCGIAGLAAKNHVRRRLRDANRVHSLTTVPAAPEEDRDAERVALALAELPDHYEAVLRAKYFEQLSVGEIAKANGGSEKAVESLLTRARQAFRDAYARGGESP